jgi:uncharacterized RDD family membrane protein YckC
MGGWPPAAPAFDPSVKIPEGMQVAGMGRRIGAWILDDIFGGLLAIIPMIVAIVVRAVSLNQEALDQIDSHRYDIDPLAQVTAPLFTVEMGSLAIIAILYVVMMALYFVWSWIAWGASPAQKLLGLRVADASTGGNLRLDQALLRWVVLTGVTQIIGVITLLLVFDWLAKTPTNEWITYNRYGSATTSGSFGLGGGYTLLSYGTSLWPIVLVIVTGIDKMKRGWHDKLAGSIVLGPLQYSAYAAYPGYGAAPVWPPQPAGSPPPAPMWPPQPAGTPPQAPMWPPQPVGAPPQAPGYPPSAYPGYPPSAYPGYPGYPPQAQPPSQPAAPETPPAAPATEKPAPKRTRTPKS